MEEKVTGVCVDIPKMIEEAKMLKIIAARFAKTNADYIKETTITAEKIYPGLEETK